jgi:hypothetical protein
MAERLNNCTRQLRDINVVIEWLDPVLTGYKHRQSLRELFASGLAAIIGQRTSIAFTGMEGVGKSVLLDQLTGKAFKPGYQLPFRSQAIEAGKPQSASRRLLVKIVPGQANSSPRQLALE